MHGLQKLRASKVNLNKYFRFTSIYSFFMEEDCSWMYRRTMPGVMGISSEFQLEAATFYSYYFEPHVSTKARDPLRNDEGDQPEVRESGLSICNGQRRAYGKTTTRYLDDKKYKAATNYILLNCDEVEPDIHTRISEEFSMWFREEVRYPRRLSQEVVLFKCDWFDSHLNRGLKIHDKYKLTSRIDVEVQDIGTLVEELGKLESVDIRRRNSIVDEDENNEDEEEVEWESDKEEEEEEFRSDKKRRAHQEPSTPPAEASIPPGTFASLTATSTLLATLTPFPHVP
ncbi:hypothetical protein M9H77_02858 [Catharanthus roseus]|uniref:Uncharacterized protein n=1 Tax=Catharanthus roseus TaxID=4058 RepID=A0ACC0C9R6_CATRO|nr:hypothetical protein M9H77_02858 [Catharanthus roseus]